MKNTLLSYIDSGVDYYKKDFDFYFNTNNIIVCFKMYYYFRKWQYGGI